MERKSLIVGVSILTVMVTLIAGFIFTRKPAAFAGTVYTPPLDAANIALTDHNGQSFKSQDLRGKVMLVFFGYTNCPDECPLTLAKLKQTFDLLGAQSADAQVLLVTTDPARDTPQILKAYLANFNPSFLGLTGTPEELQKVYGDYGVAVLDGGETHSSRVYVVDRNGKLRVTFPSEMQPNEMASDLKILLGEK